MWSHLSALVVLAEFSLVHSSDAGANRLNWFHLQHQSDRWSGHMQTMTKELSGLASRIDEEYPGSKMGSAGFTDKSEDDEYIVNTNLTSKAKFLENLLSKYPATWKPTLLPAVGEWPTDDSDVTDAVYAERKGKSSSEPEGVQEPIIWAALHVNWEETEKLLKLITVAMTGLPHFDGDGSAEDLVTRKRNERKFARNAYPTKDDSFWPEVNPDHGYWSRYAEASLTKDVLKETNCQLVVLYAIDGNKETPKKGWQTLLTELGVDHKEALFYMPESIDALSNVISYIYHATGRTTTSTSTTTPSTTPTTTSTTPTTTTSTTTTTPTTTPSTTKSTTVTTKATTSTRTTTPTTSATTTLPKTTSTATVPSTSGSDSKLTSTSGDDNCERNCTSPDAACWKGKGLLLAIDEKPRTLEINLVG